MTIKEFIEKAIEGGWIYQDEKPVYDNTQKAPCIARFTFDGINFGITLEQIILDPLAWQAVGKVEGWNERGKHNMKGNNLRCSDCGEKPHVGTGVCYRNHKDSEWKNNMHQMIDALTEGRSLEEFISTL